MDARPHVEGYADRLSYAPGETVGLHLSSSSPTLDVEIAREGAERDIVWSRSGVSCGDQGVRVEASTQGCGWSKTLDVPIPSGWRSGYYDVRLSTSGLESHGFFVVRSAVPGSGTSILLQLSTNTYNAYNNWGGYSLYAYNGKEGFQGRRVSFDRPPASQFDRWEQPFVRWAEQKGYRFDFAVNSDLEFRPEMLKAYRLVLSVGHDEYWSAPMRDHLEGFIGAGGNVAFFSGNAVCWQVRSEEGGRALACWKQEFTRDPVYPSGDHSRLSTLWSHHLVGRPENQLTGVGFLYGGYHRSHGQFREGSGAYTVHRPGHWLFAGTNLERGARFGGKDTIVGYECDGCEIKLLDGLPVPTHRDGTPESFEILATCEARWHPDDCEWYERWEKGRVGAAVLGSYTRGGTVVTVGSTDWSHGLQGGDAAVERITSNILDRLSV